MLRFDIENNIDHLCICFATISNLRLLQFVRICFIFKINTISSITKSYRYTKQSLSTPCVTWCYKNFSNHSCFATVNSHANFFFHINFEQVFEGIIILIQSSLSKIDNELPSFKSMTNSDATFEQRSPFAQWA